MSSSGSMSTSWWRRSRGGTSVTRRRWLPPGLVSERNVKVSLVLAMLGTLVSTLAHGHLFTAFIFELYGDNASVGLVESVAGIAALATALPVGLAVDRIPRAKLLRACAVPGLLAAVLGAVTVLAGPLVVSEDSGGNLEGGKRQRPGQAFTGLLLASLALWGIFFNTATSASTALFADSVPQGARRRDLYSLKSALSLTFLSIGPFMALVGTVVQGNDWKLEHMPLVLLPGFVLILPMCVLLTRFEEVRLDPRDGVEQASASDAKVQPVVQPPGYAAVPYLLLAAELITSIGAGMTVKFFGLWFKNSFNFSPAGLAGLQAITPLGIALAVQALRLTAEACPWGPVPAVLGFWSASILALLAMGWCSDWRVLVVLHLLRTALANCKEPIARAILADAIHPSQRGRWNAVHSLTGVTWTGSAALGGFLCDRFGYGKTFMITAVLYVIAGLFWLPLIRLVPHDKKRAAGGAEGDAVSDKVKGG